MFASHGLMAGASSPLQSYSKQSGDFPYPIISDPKRELAVQLGMLDPDEKDKAGLPLTCRAVRSDTIQAAAAPSLAVVFVLA